MKKRFRLGSPGTDLLIVLFLLLVLAARAFASVEEMAPAVQEPITSDNGNYQYFPFIQKGPLGPPTILQFAANVEVADPGDTIELSWQTQDTITNTLYHLLPSGQLSTWWNVAAAGTMTYTIPANARNQERFVLFALNDAFPYDTAMLSITLNCPDDWFFSPAPDICPQDAPLVSPGAEQDFEQGVMIWVEGLDGIIVLYDDTLVSPRWDFYLDEWDEGDPVSDPTIEPPPGLYQPVRGFGLVWREQPNVRDRLGWALASEVQFETAVQSTSYYKYNSTYVRALDGDVWWLEPERSGWQKIVVDTALQAR